MCVKWIITDPSTGATTTVTYPNWQMPASGSSQIVSQGTDVFVLDQTGAVSSQGLAPVSLLRYDSLANNWQSFGGASSGSSSTCYTGLAAGRDGLVYAEVNLGFAIGAPAPESEVYDPGTLQLLRVAPSLFTGVPPVLPNTTPQASVDAAGNIYELGTVLVGNSVMRTVLKLAPSGAVLATLNVDANQLFYVTPFENLQVSADGNVFVAARNALVVVDPTLTKVKTYSTIQPEFTMSLINP